VGRENISRRGPRNCRSLGFPGFPVESCGFEKLHVVLFEENHINGTGENCEVGNPASLGMTKEWATVSWRVVAVPKPEITFHRKFALSLVIPSSRLAWGKLREE